ncbi:hypothetical protein Droror1_Dr00014803 [Drosera rotundifolia]
MKKGELALLLIAPEYAFGSSESKQELAVVPPNSTIYYEVEHVSFEKEKESWDMNTKEKIEMAGKRKKKEMRCLRLVNMLGHLRDMRRVPSTLNMTHLSAMKRRSRVSSQDHLQPKQCCLQTEAEGL